jgi:DNA-binding GntR family transcriptional regulator
VASGENGHTAKGGGGRLCRPSVDYRTSNQARIIFRRPVIVSNGRGEKHVGGVVPENIEKARAGRVLARRESMHVAILEQLRLDIVKGRWQAGERLPEPLLCEEFGVSRTPLRDAFRILETEGLVELIPHVGAVVTAPEAADITGAFQVLSLLEAGAAEIVARDRSPAVLKNLAKTIELMQIALEKGNHRRYFELNDDFHYSIVEGANNPVMRQMHEHLMWHVHRVRHMINRRRPFGPEAGTGNEHHAIMQAIVEGNPGRAFELARAHLAGVGAATLTDAGLMQTEAASASV